MRVRVLVVVAILASAVVLAQPASSQAAGPSVPQPFTSWAQFVDRQHTDLLGKAPTATQRSQAVARLSSGAVGPGAYVAEFRTSNDHVQAIDPAARLYRAFFLRIPDAGGLNYWIVRRRTGSWTLAKIASQFAASSEFRNRYGALSNLDFVKLIYDNVLRRPYDQGGLNYWTRQLDLKRRSRGEVMIGFSESSEYRTAQAHAVTAAVLPVLMLGRAATTQEFNDAVAALAGGGSVADYATTILELRAYGTRVATPPALADTPLPAAEVGLAYDASLVVTGGHRPFTWSAPGLPAGLMLVDGTISGSPTVAGTSTVQVTVTDVDGRQATRSYVLTVAPRQTAAPVLPGGALPAATPGQPYRADLAVNHGSAPFTWALESGTLPRGLVLDGATITGTPQSEGNAAFSLRVTDHLGRTAIAAYTIAVGESPLVVAPISSRSLRVGRSMALTMQATGGTAPYRWTAEGLPPGMWIDAMSGWMGGTPTQVTSGPVSISVTDAQQLVTTVTWQPVFDTSVEQCGELTGRHRWAGDREHWICPNLVLAEGAVLEIEAGAVVRGSGSFLVRGSLVVEGSMPSPVVATDQVAVYLDGTSATIQLDHLDCEQGCLVATSGSLGSATDGDVVIRDSSLLAPIWVASRGEVTITRSRVRGYVDRGAIEVGSRGPGSSVTVTDNEVSGRDIHGGLPPEWSRGSGIEIVSWSPVEPVVRGNEVTDARGVAIVVVARTVRPDRYRDNTASGAGELRVALGGRIEQSVVVGDGPGLPVGFDAAGVIGSSIHSTFPFSEVPYEELHSNWSIGGLVLGPGVALSVAAGSSASFGEVYVDAGATLTVGAGVTVPESFGGQRTYFGGPGSVMFDGTSARPIAIAASVIFAPLESGSLVLRHARCAVGCEVSAGTNGGSGRASNGVLEVTDTVLDGPLQVAWDGPVTIERSTFRRGYNLRSVVGVAWGGRSGTVSVQGNRIEGLDRWGGADTAGVDGIRVTSWAQAEPVLAHNTVADVGGTAYVMISRRLHPSRHHGNEVAGTVGRSVLSLGGVLGEDVVVGPAAGVRLAFDASFAVPWQGIYWGELPVDEYPASTLVVPSGRSLVFASGSSAPMEYLEAQSGSVVRIEAGAVLERSLTENGSLSIRGDFDVLGTSTSPVALDGRTWISLDGAAKASVIDHLVCLVRCGISLDHAGAGQRTLTVRDSVVRGPITVPWTSRPVTVERTELHVTYRDGGIYVRSDGPQALVALRDNEVTFSDHRPDRCHPVNAGIGVNSWWPGIQPVVERNHVTGMTMCEAYIVTARDLRPSRLTSNTGDGNARNAVFVSGYLAEDLQLPQPGLPIGRAYNYLAEPTGWPQLPTPEAPTPVMPITVPVGRTLTLDDGYVMPMSTSQSCNWAGSWCNFTPAAGLSVEGGSLLAKGTEAAPVSFDAAGGTWGGISISSGYARFGFADLYNVYGTGLAVSEGTVTFRGRIRDSGSFAAWIPSGISSCHRPTDGSAPRCNVDARFVDWGDPSGPGPHGTGPTVCGLMRIAPWGGGASEFTPETRAPFQCRDQPTYFQQINQELEALCAAVEDCSGVRTIGAYLECHDAISRTALDLAGGEIAFESLVAGARPEWEEDYIDFLLGVGMDLAAGTAAMVGEVTEFSTEMLQIVSDLAALFGAGQDCKAAFD